MIRKLHDLHEAQFAEKLHSVVSHSRPIADERHLKGREAQLRDVANAIYAPGRHVFVFGERGVGKTSLAKTAAIRASDGSENFRQVGCASDMGFSELMARVIPHFVPSAVLEQSFRMTAGLGRFFQYEKTDRATGALSTDISVSAAADLLANLDNNGQKTRRVVVIDEIDRLVGDEVRRSIAELIKLLGDRGASLTFVFTGVGNDLTSILGSHASSFRQLAQIELHRINYQSALDIIDDALDCFGLNWEEEPTRTARFRIASVANGFPYYVHLITEKLLWRVYEDKSAESVSLEHLRLAVEDSVRDAQEEIRKAYDLATRGRTERYKHTAWAAADSWDLERSAQDIYRSYCGITQSLGQPQITKQQCYQVLAALRREKYGPLLKTGFRTGQYEFTENIVRGFVRLCAAIEGVELQDLGPSEGVKVTAHGKEKRYADPRRFGGPPRGF